MIEHGLPTEITLLISKFTHQPGVAHTAKERYPHLLACSQVCLHWAAWAQKRLFERVFLPSGKRSELFLDTVKADPHLAGYVKELRHANLSSPSGGEGGFNKTQQILNYCTSIKTLVVFRSPEPTETLGFMDCRFFFHEFNATSTSTHWRNEEAALESLSIVDNELNPPLFPLFNLRYLHLEGIHLPSPILKALLSPEISPSLRVLYFHHDRPAFDELEWSEINLKRLKGLSCWARFLPYLAPQLPNLELFETGVDAHSQSMLVNLQQQLGSSASLFTPHTQR